MNTIAQEFTEQSISIIVNKNTPKIMKCLDQLSEAQIWQRPNQASNSIGNLLLHLCGNIRQYIMATLGDQPDIRERDKEFSAKGGYNKAELRNKLSATLDEAVTIIKNMDEPSLMKVYSVQGFNYSGIGIIVQVTEHYSHHTGQVIFWTKMLTGNDLRLYVDQKILTK
ncbi:MAG: DinB family protein [Bacteroidota bacterium]|nr:DinB family protein [Bacteroidota bacterium]